MESFNTLEKIDIKNRHATNRLEQSLLVVEKMDLKKVDLKKMDFKKFDSKAST